MAPVRYAVVGLGHIAQVAILPAFAHSRNSELVALITGDPLKARKLAKKHDVPAYHYDDFERAVIEEGIAAVFIALPNTQHRPFTERAAACGVHVLCEKPMSTTEKDCRAMIAACEKANVRLMVAYRLHFAPAHLKAVALVRSGKLGDLRYFSSVFGSQVRPDNIRTDPKDGGGPLRDLGVYCINAARYIFGEEPEEVRALTLSKRGDKRFGKVEEMASALLTFPGERVAQFTVSFGSAKVASLEIVGTKGALRMDPAYSYTEKLKWTITSGSRRKKQAFPVGDQFAPELTYFSDCVRKGKRPEPDGKEGLADVRIVEAIFKSAKSGRAVAVGKVPGQKRVKPSQGMHRPPARKVALVRTEPPHSGK